LLKPELIQELRKKHSNLKSSQISNVIGIIFSAIEESLIKNQPIEIRNFGRFSIKEIKERHNARNPKTLEIIYVPKRKKVSFKTSKHLKELINSE